MEFDMLISQIKPFSRINRLKIFLLLVLFLITSINHGKENKQSPGPRWGHSFIFDQARNELLLFGGSRERGSYLGDTWVWKDGNWNKKANDGPAPRGFSAIAYHEKRQTIILHGGRGNERQTYSDTWEWNGVKWTQLNQQSEFSADHHQMVYLPESNQIMSFGGWNGKGVSGDTWLWETKWQKSPEVSPPPRAAYGMTYDTNINRVVLFGGLWVNGQYADLWYRDNKGWKQQGGHYDRSSLDHHAMTYEQKNQQVLLFGGKNYRRIMQKHLVHINNNKFTDLTDSGPKARHSFGIAYNYHNHKIYIYGGKIYQGEEQLPLADFWQWDGRKWESTKY